MVEADAPGKLVVCGEYAVLSGAPAIAIAMDVRARAIVAARPGPTWRLGVAGGGRWDFRVEDGVPGWAGTPPAQGQGGILEAALATLAAAGLRLSDPLDITLDTRDFSRERPGTGVGKLGLGSSAAVTVALVAALVTAARGAAPPATEVFALARESHRRFQKGAGSGIDVAAAVHGGVVALPGGGRQPKRLGWPDGLAWLAAWSGTSASTTALVARFEAFRRDDPARASRHLALLGDLAAAALAAWEQGDVPALLRSLADYDDALRALDDGAGIGIYTPAHARLARVAQGEGAVYKVSGAGGGDFGIALADSQEVIARVAAVLGAEGVLTLPGTAGAAGLRVTAP